MARFNRRVTAVRFEDAVGNGLTLTGRNGDLQIGETNAENYEHLRVLDAGQFDGFAPGDDLEQEVSLSLQMKPESLTSTVQARVRDFLQKTGTFASAQSVDGNVWAFVVRVTMTLGANTATMKLPYVRGGHSIGVGKEYNTISFSGTNNGEIEVT